MSNSVIYHIDTNFLLSYLINDDPEINNAVKKKLKRRNWSNDVYKISIYALGEAFKRVLKYPYNNSISWDSVVKRMEEITELINQGKLVVFDLKESGTQWICHFKELMQIKDSFIQTADRFILAFFCSDENAKKFYTFDSKIIESKDINDYVKKLHKEIAEVSKS